MTAFDAELAEYRAARAALAAFAPDGPAAEVIAAEERVAAAAAALAAAADLAAPRDESKLMHRRFLDLIDRIAGEFADTARRIDEIRRVVNVNGSSSDYSSEAERVLHLVFNMLPNSGLDRLPAAAAEADRYR